MEFPGGWTALIASLSVADLDNPGHAWRFLRAEGLVNDVPEGPQQLANAIAAEVARGRITGRSLAARIAEQLVRAGLAHRAARLVAALLSLPLLLGATASAAMKLPRSMRISLLPALTAVIAACPFPHPHLKEPSVTFAVQSHQGLPVSHAHLSFYGGFIVGHAVQLRYESDADSSGIIRVPRRHEWHWFFMPIPDGEASWVWAWCISAPGFENANGQLDREPADTVHIRLRRSTALVSACPHAPQSLYDVVAPGSKSPLVMRLALLTVPRAHSWTVTQSVSPDTAQAIAFLEFLKSGENDAARTQGFAVVNGGYWNNDRMLKFFDSTGVTFSDVNGDTTWHVSRARMRSQLARRSGAAFTMLVHLAHIYGQREPEYSKLTFSSDGQDVIVTVGDWYRLTFVHRGRSLGASKIEYLRKEVE